MHKKLTAKELSKKSKQLKSIIVARCLRLCRLACTITTGKPKTVPVFWQGKILANSIPINLKNSRSPRNSKRAAFITLRWSGPVVSPFQTKQFFNAYLPPVTIFFVRLPNGVINS